jgi:hypothetical protein
VEAAPAVALAINTRVTAPKDAVRVLLFVPATVPSVQLVTVATPLAFVLVPQEVVFPLPQFTNPFDAVLWNVIVAPETALPN